ncbi:MAG: polysaccharide biosynthesis C-terminal domain-containing protein [Agathobacter rectalis]
MTKATITGAIINTILNAFLIYKIALMGAVIATMISYFVVWLIITYDTNKAMNLSLNISRIVISVILLCVQWWLLVIFESGIVIQIIFLIGIIVLHGRIICGLIRKMIGNVLQKLK